ncbi:MAG: CotS family spore coat protein [Eubacteriales bacterium]
MDDRAVALLDRYDMTVLRTWKGRGAILCDTEQGLKILKEYHSTKEQLERQHRVLMQLQELGLHGIEQILQTKEEELSTKDYNDISYIVKDYWDGRECNVKELEQCMIGMQAMAHFHKVSLRIDSTTILEQPNTLNKEVEKHNKELKKILQYLRKKSQKSDFEVFFLHHYQTFYEKALMVQEEVETIDWKIPYTYCHGDFQYHNVLIKGLESYLINLEKIHMDNRVKDISLYMRKVLEKQGWSMEVGKKLLDAYEVITPLSKQEYQQLYYRFAYPEKFWKIANYYFNSGKAFVSVRNRDKLEKLLNNQSDAQQFMNSLYKLI